MRQAIVLVALIATSPALAQVQQFYGADGGYVGQALPSGSNAKQYYGSDGSHIGTGLRAGRNTMLYSADGSYAGMITNTHPSPYQEGE